MALVPRKITDADVERVLTATLESTPRDATHWSTRSLAQHCDMSQTAVARIWKAFALQPQRVDTFKLSKDPLFIDKVRDIVGLYLDPPARAVPADLDVHLILDNYGTHKTAPVRWFARHPRLHVHFTPTSASWLNLVERWFATLTQKQIKRGAHRSTRALETAIREYLTISNEAPKPFVWHKTADAILASVARYCQRISNSGH